MTTTTNHRHSLATREETLAFMTNGTAVFTVVSLKSGTRFTYKVSKAKPNPKYPNNGDTFWVNLLSGPDNMGDYQGMGMMRAGRFIHGRWADVSANAPSVVAFKWLTEQIDAKVGKLPAKVEVWTEGRCCRCGHRLTVPASISRYYGPECASKLGLPEVEALPSEQDMDVGF